MTPALVVRFRPSGPWRIGPDSGARDRVDRILHSDTLFSAVTHAMSRLGEMEEWLAATAGNAQGAAVRLGSCYPFLDGTLFIAPPRNLWPPLPSAKVRWRDARFIPLSLVKSLIADRPVSDEEWYVDGASGCLMPAEGEYRPGPCRVALRCHAAVDRLSQSAAAPHATACLEFVEGGGMWTVAGFADEAAKERWGGPLRAAFRLLAEIGLGGERSIGWGHSGEPEFSDGALPDSVVPAPEPAAAAEEGAEPAETAVGQWLLSMFSPSADDAIDWERGDYRVVVRGGRVESDCVSGLPKRAVRMVEEGSVLVAPAPIKGTARDVAPQGFPHPVFRSGIALAVPVPLRQTERSLGVSS